MQYTVVGVVTTLNRFPVKSMRGQALESSGMWWHGLDGDRRYAFVKSDDRSNFPWLTGRDIPDLIRYVASFSDPADPQDSPIRVTMPDGRELALDSRELRDELAERHGGPVNLIHLNRGTYDSMPISILSTATVNAIGVRLEVALDPVRFRPNILVAPVDDRPHVEDDWRGHFVRFGDRPDSAIVRFNRPVARCMMVNLDPNTARQDPRVLREVVRNHASNVAVYASVETPGTIAAGDPVYVGMP